MSVLSINPTFNAAAKTLDFSTVPNFDISRLALVTDITRNIIIYQFNGDGTIGGTYNSATKILTLFYNTTLFANSDILRCDYQVAVLQVEGSVASGVTDSGNPVKVGAVYNSTSPTFTTGQRTDLQSDANGNLKIADSGTPITGASMPAGGVGLTGWLSAIWKAITGTVSTSSVSPSNIATGQVTVGTSATLIVAARTGRKSVAIIQNGISTVYWGASGVTTTTGVALPGNAGAFASIDTQAAIYGIVSTGTNAVSFVETY